MRPALALLLAALLFPACRTPPPAYLSTDIFEDIPAPKGAEYLHEKRQSFSYRSRTFRCGRFLYTYLGSHEEVVSFYRETMTAPPYNWTLTDEDSRAAGSSRLTFEKHEDVCQVDLDRVPKPAPGGQNNVSIRVRVNYRK